MAKARQDRPIVCLISQKMISKIYTKYFTNYECILNYLQTITTGSLDNAAFTSNFDKVKEAYEQSNKICCLTGPKGCGKTFIIIALFAVYYTKGIHCLFLTPESFTSNELPCKRFCKLLVDKFI